MDEREKQQRDRQIDRQKTDRDIQANIGRINKKGGNRKRHIDRQIERQADRKMKTDKERKKDTQIDRQVDTQIDRQIDRQID